jgi:precorrin-8X/cobalt-precorrin-8 methylmutase
MPRVYEYLRDPAEITRRSYEIIAAEADFSALPADIAPLAARIVHACGMSDIVHDLAFSPHAGARGRTALAGGAPILCDVRMVVAGLMTARIIGRNDLLVALDQPGASDLAAVSGQTRTASGLQLLSHRFDGAVIVIGNAPTALFRLLELVAAGAARPALVLGFPVGFVGAAESKAALAENDLHLRYVTLHGRRGGSAIAAAALNALLLMARPG